MATAATSPSHSPPASSLPTHQSQGDHQPGTTTQRRLFRSISKFLSSSKNNNKLKQKQQQQQQQQPRTLQNHASNDVQLTTVTTTSSQSHSHHHHHHHHDNNNNIDDSDQSSLDSRGADTDASIRPISPTSLAPSSIASHTHTNSTSNNSYAPTHRTFKSYASTKPTTVLSIDSGAGANRIAVVPGTGLNHSTTSPSNQLSFSAATTQQQQQQQQQQQSPPSSPAGGSITALPSPTISTASQSTTPQDTSTSTSTFQVVPRHTQAHPRNNPHPMSPPPDNASMLTLASSSFAPSIFLSSSTRNNTGGEGGGYALSGLRTASTRIEADEDASVRALAPSRRASDESIGSRSTWSAAQVLTGNTAAIGASGVGRGAGVGGGGGGGGGTAASLRTVATTEEAGTGTGPFLSSSSGTGGGGGETTGPKESDQDQARTEEGKEETEAERLVRKEKEGDLKGALEETHHSTSPLVVESTSATTVHHAPAPAHTGGQQPSSPLSSNPVILARNADESGESSLATSPSASTAAVDLVDNKE
ncbi:hypothetical protein T439DRAFT_10333 [Meredithblackwellia eburnea MCA 4105]